jgi:hypothetical protein
LRGRTVSEKLPKIPIFGPSLIHQLRLLGSQQQLQSGVLLTSFQTWETENSRAEINLESTGMIKGCNILGVKNWQTLAALLAGALTRKKKKSRRQKFSFRIRRTTVLGMFKKFSIILDAIRQSFLTKSATAAMFTSVRVEFGRPPLSPSTSYLRSRNREYHLKS